MLGTLFQSPATSSHLESWLQFLRQFPIFRKKKTLPGRRFPRALQLVSLTLQQPRTAATWPAAFVPELRRISPAAAPRSLASAQELTTEPRTPPKPAAGQRTGSGFTNGGELKAA